MIIRAAVPSVPTASRYWVICSLDASLFSRPVRESRLDFSRVGMDLLLVLRVIQHNGVNPISVPSPPSMIRPLQSTHRVLLVLSHNAELCLKDILSLAQLIP